MPVHTRSAVRRNTRLRIEDPTPHLSSERRGTSRTVGNRTVKRKLIPHSPEGPPNKKINGRGQAQPPPRSKQRKQNKTKSNIPVKRTVGRSSNSASEVSAAPNNAGGVGQSRTESAMTPGCISARTRSYSEQKRTLKAVRTCTRNHKESDQAVDQSVVSPDAHSIKEVTNTERDEVATTNRSCPLAGLEIHVKSGQDKYSYLVKTIKELQSNFLRAQQNAEKNITAFDNVVQGLKSSLKMEQQRSLLLNEDLTAKKETLKKMREEMQSLYDEIHMLQQRQQDPGDTKNQDAAMSSGVPSASGGAALPEVPTDAERIISEQKSIIHLYSKLTGIQLRRDPTPSESTEALESFVCAWNPAGSEHHLAFRLTLDKEFEEIEYIPGRPSCNTADILPHLPDYLQENIFFENSQAPKFLARFLESFEALR